jgi:hypothetical protein
LGRGFGWLGGPGGGGLHRRRGTGGYGCANGTAGDTFADSAQKFAALHLGYFHCLHHFLLLCYSFLNEPKSLLGKIDLFAGCEKRTVGQIYLREKLCASQSVEVTQIRMLYSRKLAPRPKFVRRLMQRGFNNLFICWERRCNENLAQPERMLALEQGTSSFVLAMCDIVTTQQPTSLSIA